jgi:hypothetical protein
MSGRIIDVAGVLGNKVLHFMHRSGQSDTCVYTWPAVQQVDNIEAHCQWIERSWRGDESGDPTIQKITNCTLIPGALDPKVYSTQR